MTTKVIHLPKVTLLDEKDMPGMNLYEVAAKQHILPIINLLEKETDKYKKFVFEEVKALEAKEDWQEIVGFYTSLLTANNLNLRFVIKSVHEEPHGIQLSPETTKEYSDKFFGITKVQGT